MEEDKMRDLGKKLIIFGLVILILGILIGVIGFIIVSASTIFSDGTIGNLFMVLLIGGILGVLGLMMIIAGAITKVVGHKSEISKFAVDETNKAKTGINKAVDTYKPKVSAMAKEVTPKVKSAAKEVAQGVSKGIDAFKKN